MNDSISSTADLKRSLLRIHIYFTLQAYMLEVQEDILCACDPWIMEECMSVRADVWRLNCFVPKSSAWSQVHDNVVTSLICTRRATLLPVSTLSVSHRWSALGTSALSILTTYLLNIIKSTFSLPFLWDLCHLAIFGVGHPGKGTAVQSNFLKCITIRTNKQANE